jgi:uncharacterized protein (UPF0548 family)
LTSLELTAEPSLSPAEACRALEELRAKGLNFSLAERDRFTAETGWRFDRYLQPLPPEPPGLPVPEGSWHVARRLVRDYRLADPAIVRAVYDRDAPLDGRDMLLEVRFLGLRFYLGVRVGEVFDELREEHGRPARVWGWNYRTLEDHLEMGQQDYEVWKWVDSGDVEFRTHAFSRPAPIRNPLVRLGFHLFGRGQQTRFARHACARMARLTEAELERIANARSGETAQSSVSRRC